MDGAIWGVVLPAALALAGVCLTTLVGKRKNDRDGALGFIAVLQAELATTEADGQANRARARRFESLAWRYFQLLERSGIDPNPPWPTEISEKVTA